MPDFIERLLRCERHKRHRQAESLLLLSEAGFPVGQARCAPTCPGQGPRDSGPLSFPCRFASDATGSALVEFALILPVLLLLTFGAIDFAFWIQRSMVVSEAAHAGAVYGTLPGKDTDFVDMQAAAVAASQNLAGLQATPANWCACSPAGTPLPSCSSACPAPSGPQVEYVQVSTSLPVLPLFAYPGIPASFTVQGFSVLRVR